MSRALLALFLLGCATSLGYSILSSPRSPIHPAPFKAIRSARTSSTMSEAEEPAADTPADESDAPPAPPPKDSGDDLLSSAAFLKQKLKVLEKELEEVTASTELAKEEASAAGEEFSQKRTRLQSDFDNFRARHFNQTIDAQIDARIKLLSQFLPVLDNFDRARDSITANGPDEEQTNAEYQKMHELLMSALDDLEVTKIPTVGEEFDYNLHNAIQQVRRTFSRSLPY